MRRRKHDIDPTGMRFTRGWFRSRNLAAFREHLIPRFAGRPCLYLEIGTFEGMSAAWMLQHVLTYETSRCVCVDPWLMTTKLDAGDMEAVRLRAWDNLKRWCNYDSDAPKCTVLRANSVEALRRMLGRRGYAGVREGTVDVALVDGDHNSIGVLSDCRMVWRLLKPGGWMVCDDVRNDHPKTDHVEDGLRVFLHEVGDMARLAWEWRYGECWEKVG